MWFMIYNFALRTAYYVLGIEGLVYGILLLCLVASFVLTSMLFKKKNVLQINTRINPLISLSQSQSQSHSQNSEISPHLVHYFTLPLVVVREVVCISLCLSLSALIVTHPWEWRSRGGGVFVDRVQD